MSKKYYIIISLIWLIVAVVFATILRSSFMFGMGSWFNYKYFLHTHSHLAFLGWVFNIIYYFLLKQYNLLESKKYGTLFAILNLSVLGMLFTFPFQGYALWSITFSTLHILLSYIFAVFFYRDTRGQKSLHRKFALASIFFMVFSSLGVFSIGPILSMGLKDSIYYDLAIYFYLHFQYNGWFILSIISIVLYQVKTIDSDNWQRAFNLFFVSTILNYSLSTLWTDPGWVINIISVLSALMQFHALFLVSKDLIVHFKTLDKFQSYILKFIFVLLVVKVFFTLAGSIQEVAMFVYYNRNLVIGFLHLVFLGIVSTLFFQFIANDLGINNKAYYKRTMIFFLIVFMISEILYTLTSIGFNGNVILILSDMIVFTTWVLTAIALTISVILIKQQLKLNKT